MIHDKILNPLRRKGLLVEGYNSLTDMYEKALRVGAFSFVYEARPMPPQPRKVAKHAAGEVMPKFKLEVAGKVMYFRDLKSLKRELDRKRMQYDLPCVVLNRETGRALLRTSTKAPVMKSEEKYTILQAFRDAA